MLTANSLHRTMHVSVMYVEHVEWKVPLKLNWTFLKLKIQGVFWRSQCYAMQWLNNKEWPERAKSRRSKTDKNWLHLFFLWRKCDEGTSLSLPPSSLPIGQIFPNRCRKGRDRAAVTHERMIHQSNSETGTGERRWVEQTGGCQHPAPLCRHMWLLLLCLSAYTSRIYHDQILSSWSMGRWELIKAVLQ